MKERFQQQKAQVKAKAVANKAIIQLMWRAYQGLILATLLMVLMGQ